MCLICAGLSLGLAFAAYRRPPKRGAARTSAHRRASCRCARPPPSSRTQETGEVLYGKNASTVAPIASITKLMTAMVVLDASLDPKKIITISSDDMDALRGTHSRLKPGASLSRDELLRLALMSSENRAASALARTYPGGIGSVRARDEPQGADAGHERHRTSTMPPGCPAPTCPAPRIWSSWCAPRIATSSSASTPRLTGHEVQVAGRPLAYRNTNRLVANESWDIGLSKTGFTNDAGRCLVLQAKLAERQVIIVLLDSWGKFSRIGDANRITRLARGERQAATAAARTSPRRKAARPAPAETRRASRRAPNCCRGTDGTAAAAPRPRGGALLQFSARGDFLPAVTC